MRGTVMLAERLGRNIELTVDVGGAQLIVLASGREGVGEGDAVTDDRRRLRRPRLRRRRPGDTPRLGAVDHESPWRQHSEP